MKIKAKYIVTHADIATLALVNKEDTCLSIINQIVPNKAPKIYDCSFVIDPITENEATTLSCAFSNHKEFNHTGREVLSLCYRGEVLCDNNDNILDPSSLSDFMINQKKHWEETFLWSVENDDEINQFHQEEVYDPCQQNSVVNADW